jgi:hypothetical protein
MEQNFAPFAQSMAAAGSAMHFDSTSTYGWHIASDA